MVLHLLSENYSIWNARCKEVGLSKNWIKNNERRKVLDLIDWGNSAGILLVHCELYLHFRGRTCINIKCNRPNLLWNRPCCQCTLPTSLIPVRITILHSNVQISAVWIQTSPIATGSDGFNHMRHPTISLHLRVLCLADVYLLAHYKKVQANPRKPGKLKFSLRLNTQMGSFNR